MQVDEDSVFRHKDERRVRTIDDDDVSNTVESELSQEPDSQLGLASVESDGDTSGSESHPQVDDNSTAGQMKDESPSLTEKRKEDNFSTEIAKSDQTELETNFSDLNLEAGSNSTEADGKVKDSADKQNDNSSDDDDDDDGDDGGHEVDDLETQTDLKDRAMNDAEDESLFPDTNIELQYVKGEK